MTDLLLNHHFGTRPYRNPTTAIFMPSQLRALLELSPDEKLDTIEALWTSLNQSPELIPLPEWQKQELNRSKAQYDAHPESLLTWEEVQANILAKHG